MSLAAKANFVLALYLAHRQTQEGVECFYRMRERIKKGDYAKDDKIEQKVSELFHCEIDGQGLGDRMIDIAAKLKDLYAHVSDLCVNCDADSFDFCLGEAQIKFGELVEEWQPLSAACEAIDKRLRQLKKKQRTRKEP